VIHTWALQRWASHDGVLYRSTGWCKKRGHPISLQIFWKLHDRIAQKYCIYFLALLIIVCFDDVTLTSQFLFCKFYWNAAVVYSHCTNRIEHHTVSASEVSFSRWGAIQIYKVVQKTGPSYLIANILKTPWRNCAEILHTFSCFTHYSLLWWRHADVTVFIL